MINQLGVPPEEFGYYQAVIVAVFFATNLAVNRYSDRVPGRTLLLLASILALLGGSLGIGLAALDAVVPWSLCAVMTLFAATVALVYAVAPLKAMPATKAATGMAASWRGFLEMSGAMLGSAGVTALHDGTPWPLVMVLAAAAVCIAASNACARLVDRGGLRAAAA